MTGPASVSVLVALPSTPTGVYLIWSSITAARIQTVRHQWRASPTSLIRGARPSTYAGLKQTESLRQPGRTDTKRRACRKLVLTGQKKPPASLPIRLKTDRKQSDDRVSRIDGSQIVLVGWQYWCFATQRQLTEMSQQPSVRYTAVVDVEPQSGVTVNAEIYHEASSSIHRSHDGY
jgi:hypothetical protein